jgi:hypothetical protein
MGKLARIAYKVRDAFEEIGEKEGLPSDLCGLCLRSSVQLFTAAKYFDINIQVVGGYGHCYTMCDGYIVDVTATQFSESESVLIVPPNCVVEYHDRRSRRWEKGEVCKSLSDVYTKIWDEEYAFESDRRIVVKYLRPLMREELTWPGKESVAYM